MAVTIEKALDPVYLYQLCYELTTKVPDSGNTPQKIAAFLLKNYHRYMFSGVVVTGEEKERPLPVLQAKNWGCK